uniref:Uncharacterized protein n=1 Tax=viral metagenome TaxID=1070528 RepID=A0A6M3KVR5_9ZZZZ
MTDERTTRSIEVVEERLASLERVIAQSFAATDKALQLQARIYDDRLATMDRETGRLLTMLNEIREKYLPRETYESSGLLWKQGFIAIIVGIVVLAATLFVR